MATPKILVLEGMHGIGDCLIQAPVAGQLSNHWGSRGLSKILLRTPWPQLYRKWDNLKFLPPKGCEHLNHAMTNVDQCPGYYFQDEPLKGEVTRLPLGRPTAHKDGISFYEAFAKIFEDAMGMPLPETDYSIEVPDIWKRAARMQAMPAIERAGTKKIVALNLPTLMKSPCFKSRLPSPQIVVDVVRMIHEAGHFVVSFASTGGGEWIVGQRTSETDVLPGERAYEADYDLIDTFDCIEELLGFIAQVDAVITPVSGIQQIAIATRTPCLTIYGGHLANHHIVDERMGLDIYRYLAPDPFCNCHQDDHACYKDIPASVIVDGVQDFLDLIGSPIRNAPYRIPDFSTTKEPSETEPPLDLYDRVARLEQFMDVTCSQNAITVGQPAVTVEPEPEEEFEIDGDLWIRTKYRDQDHVLVDAVYNKDEYEFTDFEGALPIDPLNFMDIGGAIGSATRAWLSFRPSDHCAVFEACPDNWEILAKNLEGWSDQVTIFRAAVWPYGEAFHLLNAMTPAGCESTGGSTMVRMDGIDEWHHAIEEGRYFLDGRKVDTFSLDAAMSAAGMKFVDVLKIDAEGAEYEIFAEGAISKEFLVESIGTIIGEYHSSQWKFLNLKQTMFCDWELFLMQPRENIGMFFLFNPKRWKDGKYQPVGQA